MTGILWAGIDGATLDLCGGTIGALLGVGVTDRDGLDLRFGLGDARGLCGTSSVL